MPIINLMLIVGGLVSILYLYPKQKRDLLEIQYMRTKTVQELVDMFDTMDRDGFGDNYTEFVELKGRVASGGVITPFSKRSVAYYESSLSSVNEVERVDYDDKGNRRVRIVREEDLISSDSSSNVISISDMSSHISIDIEINAPGCNLDIPKTWDRLDPNYNFGGYNSRNTFGMRSMSPRGRFLGYRMIEKTIENNSQLYVLGEAFRFGSSIQIGRPKDPKKPFIVSTKSEETVINEKKMNSNMLLFGGIAAIIIGIALFFTDNNILLNFQ